MISDEDNIFLREHSDNGKGVHIMGKEKTELMSEILQLNMSKERQDALEDTYAEWMGRARRLDEKISRLGLVAPPAANIFMH